jgi:hypothetical protein
MPWEKIPAHRWIAFSDIAIRNNGVLTKRGFAVFPASSPVCDIRLVFFHDGSIEKPAIIGN